jgi:hypothetical protein
LESACDVDGALADAWAKALLAKRKAETKSKVSLVSLEILKVISPLSNF